jgi:hypothetical protein
MNAFRAQIRVATVLVMALLLASAQSAVAHAGHAHTSDDGLSATTMLSVVGVIVVLGITFKMTSRFSNPQALSGDDEDPTIG